MPKPTAAELDEWFKTVDVDGSGKIDPKELKAVVKALRDWRKKPDDDAKIDAEVAVRSSIYFTL